MSRSRSAFVIAVVLVAVSNGGCKLLKKTRPSGKLARTESPAQYTTEFPDQTSPEWTSRFGAASSGAHTFEARDTGKLHVWLRYGCTSKDGSFTLKGSYGVTVPGRPRIAPVPVTVTEKGASIAGLPRGDYSPITINGPRPADGPRSKGGMEADGYVYLFDLDVATQGSVTIEGAVHPDGAQCIANGLEIWRD